MTPETFVTGHNIGSRVAELAPGPRPRMVLLMTVTSIAAHLLQAPRHRSRPVLPTRIAPVLAVLGLVVCAWLVVSNFTLVTGGSAGVSTVLVLIPVAAFVLGCVLGGRYSLGEDEPV